MEKSGQFWLSGCRDCTSSNSDATAHLPELSGRQSCDGAAPLPAGTPSLGGAWGPSRTAAVPLPSSHRAAGESRPVSGEPAEEGQRALTNRGENQITGSNGRQRTSRETKSITKCLPGAQQPALPPTSVLAQGRARSPSAVLQTCFPSPPRTRLHPLPKLRPQSPFPGLSPAPLLPSPLLPSPLVAPGRLLGRPRCPRSWDCRGPAGSCAPQGPAGSRGSIHSHAPRRNSSLWSHAGDFKAQPEHPDLALRYSCRHKQQRLRVVL